MIFMDYKDDKVRTYLIPAVMASEVVMEYRVRKERRDMRNNFCKYYDLYIVHPIQLKHAIDSVGPVVKDNSIIMESAAQSRLFDAALRGEIF